MPTLTPRNFLPDESGATAVEYGLIGALVAVAAVAAFAAIGEELVAIFGITEAGLAVSDS